VASSTSDSPASATEKPRGFLGVPRVVILLGVVSLLNDLSGEMVTPLLPLFLIGPLAAPVVVVGLVEGMADSATALVKVWVGHRSDRMARRKPYIVAGYGLSALAKPLLALSAVWPQALAARVLDRSGKGVRGAPRDAAIAEATPKEILGKAFGVHRAFDTGGAVAGSLLALTLILVYAGSAGATLGQFQLIFLVASVPGLVSIGILVLGLKEARRDPGAPTRPRTGLRASLRMLPVPVRRFIGVSGVFALGNFSIAIFILRMGDFTGGSLAAGLVAYIAFNILATAASIPAGMLADARGRRPLVLLSFLLFAASCVAFALANSYATAFASFLLYGVFFAVWETGYRAYMAEICPKELKATAMGAQGTVIGLLTLPGSALAGLTWTLTGQPAYAFLLGAALTGVAMGFFLTVRGGAAPRASG
jgi:MFS family permease